MLKSDNSFRMILILKRLNENMSYIHFEIETTKSILTLMTPSCYMANADIKDAYYSVPIPERQKYLKFYFRGKLSSIYMSSKLSLLRFTQIHKVAKTSSLSKFTTSRVY